MIERISWIVNSQANVKRVSRETSEEHGHPQKFIG